MLYFGGKSETKSYLRSALSPPLPVTGELLFRPFFLRIPTQGNNVTLGRKRLNRVFGRHNESMASPGVLLEGRASRNRVCSIVSGGVFRRSFSGLGRVLIVRFFCGGSFFTMIRYDTTFFMGIQSSPLESCHAVPGSHVAPASHASQSHVCRDIRALVAFATARVKPGNHARKFGLDSGEVDGMMGWLLARKE